MLHYSQAFLSPPLNSKDKREKFFANLSSHWWKAWVAHQSHTKFEYVAVCNFYLYRTHLLAIRHISLKAPFAKPCLFLVEHVIAIMQFLRILLVALSCAVSKIPAKWLVDIMAYNRVIMTPFISSDNRPLRELLYAARFPHLHCSY